MSDAKQLLALPVSAKDLARITGCGTSRAVREARRGRKADIKSVDVTPEMASELEKAKQRHHHRELMKVAGVKYQRIMRELMLAIEEEVAYAQEVIEYPDSPSRLAAYRELIAESKKLRASLEVQRKLLNTVLPKPVIARVKHAVDTRNLVEKEISKNAESRSA